MIPNPLSVMKYLQLIFLVLICFNGSAQDMIEFSEGDLQYCLTRECNSNECEISKIEIFRDGTLMQSIKPEENSFGLTFPKDQLFKIEDMNFDGKQDFRLMEFLPAAPNVPFLFYIYNPKTKLFEHSPEYEKITSPTFDDEKEQINSSWRDGCCRHGRDVYEIKNGVPERTERYVIGHNSEGQEYSEYWQVKDGELKLIKEELH